MQIVFLTAERISSKVGKTISPWQQMSLIKTAKDGKNLISGFSAAANQKRLKDRFNGDFNFKMKKIILISEPSKKNHFWTKMNQNVIRFHFLVFFPVVCRK